MTIKTEWHPGTEIPKEEGRYFVIAEATRDVGEYNDGDIELVTDFWAGDGYGFDGCGRPCDVTSPWNILWWSRIPKVTPDVLPVGVKLGFIDGTRVSDE